MIDACCDEDLYQKGRANKATCPTCDQAAFEAAPTFDLVSSLIDYEDGRLDEEQTLALFQNLVSSGLAWRLQGHYGRMAEHFIATQQIEWTEER